jgi:hypothetical protein
MFRLNCMVTPPCIHSGFDLHHGSCAESTETIQSLEDSDAILYHEPPGLDFIPFSLLESVKYHARKKCKI